MEKLERDNLFSLAIELNLPDLLRFCSSNRKINDKVCKQNDIWNYKIAKEFPDSKDFKNNLSPKDKYILLYSLRDVKQKLQREETIYELYDLKELDLRPYYFLEKLPATLEYLSNLRVIHINLNREPKRPASLKNYLKKIAIYGYDVRF
jgi:hypothetical protein